MRAAVMHAYGVPEDLKIEEVPDPVLKPGCVIVDVKASSVNFPDVLIIANKYQVTMPLPLTPGSEFAGVVSAVGEGVDNLQVGDRVMGATFVGAFAEKVLAPAMALRKISERVDFASAAAYMVTYQTSYHALRSVAEAKAGEWVVVLGAAGGVGSAAIDLAKVLGCKVIACASDDDKLKACRDRGADATINYETENLKERIKEITGGGAAIVIDPVGGRYSEDALRACKWKSRFVVVGFAAGDIPRIPLNLVLLKGVHIMGFEVRTFPQNEPELYKRDMRELMQMLDDGFKPLIGATFPLAQAAEALRFVADRRAIGKVIVTND